MSATPKKHMNHKLVDQEKIHKRNSANKMGNTFRFSLLGQKTMDMPEIDCIRSYDSSKKGKDENLELR
jgi:hypothetical protein